MTPSVPSVSTQAAQQAHCGSRVARVQAYRQSSFWPVTSAATKWLAVSALAVGSLLATAIIRPAQASNLVWSVGVQAPGAVVHVGNGPAPRVVYQYPVPVATYPHVGYPVVVMPQPWIAPAPRPNPGWYGSHGRHHRDHHSDYYSHGYRDGQRDRFQGGGSHHRYGDDRGGWQGYGHR